MVSAAEAEIKLGQLDAARARLGGAHAVLAGRDDYRSQARMLGARRSAMRLGRWLRPGTCTGPRWISTGRPAMCWARPAPSRAWATWSAAPGAARAQTLYRQALDLFVRQKDSWARRYARAACRHRERDLGPSTPPHPVRRRRDATGCSARPRRASVALKTGDLELFAGRMTEAEQGFREATPVLGQDELGRAYRWRPGDLELRRGYGECRACAGR
jgi:hypothetical protein